MDEREVKVTVGSMTEMGRGWEWWKVDAGKVEDRGDEAGVLEGEERGEYSETPSGRISMATTVLGVS